MLYTITNSGVQNGRPTQIGANTISVAFAATHVFTLANFTTETSPVYSDPEDDALSYIKILSLPSTGTLKLNGVDVVLGSQVASGQISTGNFTYISSGDGDYTFSFDAADSGSNSLSGLSTGVITMNVATAVNLPPSAVGDNTIASSYGETIIFTSANFTTETSPVYSDPEGDAASMLKILTLPATGSLMFNGSNVIANQEITFAEIDSGYLIYNPDLLVTSVQSLTFTFAIADQGSGIYTTS